MAQNFYFDSVVNLCVTVFFTPPEEDLQVGRNIGGLDVVSYLHLCFSVYIYIYIALWCKNQIEHSIWDESLLFSNCACSLEYSSLSTLAGLSYHICGKLEVAFKGSPSSQHQHCTDEAQKAETVQLLAFWLSSKGSVSLFISIDYHGKCSYRDD